MSRGQDAGPLASPRNLKRNVHIFPGQHQFRFVTFKTQFPARNGYWKSPSISSNMPPLFSRAVMRVLPRFEKSLYVFLWSNVKYCHPDKFFFGESIHPNRSLVHFQKSKRFQVVNPHWIRASFKRYPELFIMSRRFRYFGHTDFLSAQYLNSMLYDSVDPTLCSPSCCLVSTGSVVVTVV